MTQASKLVFFLQSLHYRGWALGEGWDTIRDFFQTS